MRRRKFIALLGNSAVAWPLAARAQQPERTRRISVFVSSNEEPDLQTSLAAFVQAPEQLGWAEGRIVRIETRWAGGDARQIRGYAAELAALAPDVILVHGVAAMGPLLEATRTIPIVFCGVSDPVGAGLVDSLVRSGGNATGFLNFEYSLSGKWLELLKEIAPGVTRAAAIRDANISTGIGQFAVMQAVAPGLGVDVSAINMRDAAEIERGVASFARSPNEVGTSCPRSTSDATSSTSVA